MAASGSLDGVRSNAQPPTLKIPRDSKQVAKHSGEILLLDRAFYPAEGVLTVGKDGAVVAWPKVGRPGQLLFTLPAAPDAAALCRNGTLLAAADKSAIRIVSLTEGEPRAQFNTIETRVLAMAFSPDCRSILIGGADGMVYRWKFADWRSNLSYPEREKLLERYVAHSTAVSAVVFHPYGRIFFTGDWDGALNAWLRYDSDAFGGEYSESYVPGSFFTTGVQRMRAGRDAGNDINTLITTSDGQYLLLAMQTGTIELWKVRGLRKVAEISAHKGIIYSANFTADETGVVTLGRDGHARTWTLDKSPDPAGGPDIHKFLPLHDIPLSAGGRESELRLIVPTTKGALIGGTLRGGVVPVQSALPAPSAVATGVGDSVEGSVQ